MQNGLQILHIKEKDLKINLPNDNQTAGKKESSNEKFTVCS